MISLSVVIAIYNEESLVKSAIAKCVDILENLNEEQVRAVKWISNF